MEATLERITEKTVLAQDLKYGQSLLESGQYLEALKTFAKILETNLADETAYEGAAQAFAAVLSDQMVFDTWDEVERDRFLTTLILQVHCDKSPPILHHRIASAHTSGIPRALEHAWRALKPVIARLLDSSPQSKNLVLLILLLREYMEELISQRKITQMHLASVDKFTFGDLGIPYNCMFDSGTFKRNKNDIDLYVSSLSEQPQLFERLHLYHIVFFEWLTQRNILDTCSDVAVTSLLAPRTESAFLSPGERAAAKSMILRHRRIFVALDKTKLQTFELDSEFVALADRVNKIREELDNSSSHERATLGMRIFDNNIYRGLQVTRGIVGRRISFLGRSRRKAKVAICISGQLRGYASAYESWKNTLLRDVNYELFVHSWRRVGRSSAEPFRYFLPFEGEQFTKAYRNICQQIGQIEFESRYPTLFRALSDTDVTSEKELSNFYDTPHVRLDDDKAPPFAALSNQEKMHNKIQLCFDMAMASGGEYDLIIRLRPDKPIKFLAFDWADLRRLCHATPTLFADHAVGVHYATLMVGDQFAIGAPGPMRIYSSTWTRYPEFASHKVLQCPSEFAGHASLAQVCWMHSINVRKVPIRFGDLQEIERLSTRTIIECLREDAGNRMNGFDRVLLDAASADLD